jgi:SAM-dependent methyltransferase
VEERFYTEYAEVQDRHWWFVGRRRLIGAVLDAALPSVERNGRRILDVGCGTGTMLTELRRFGDVHGVDTEAAAVEFCHSRGESQVQLASGGGLPHPDDSFDVVTLLDVIEHVDDDQTLLAEARRVIAPGGSLFVTVPAYRWMWGAQDEIAHHKRRYTRAQLRDSLTRAGFRVERASYFNTILFPPIAAIRLVRRVLPEPAELQSDFHYNEPGRLNTALTRVFARESAIVSKHDLPFGVSILALATLPTTD